MPRQRLRPQRQPVSHANNMKNPSLYGQAGEEYNNYPLEQWFLARGDFAPRGHLATAGDIF